ncbi:MAG: zinc-ribbon domain-containing protein [Anaerolineae bacterium]|nr:zinc-ribbon domain-containing protein [Anaerolineae bacterium]
MDIPATLAFIATLILVVAFIIRPFLAPQKEKEKQADHPSASTLRRRADLLAGRNRVYRALRDLDFERQTNKVGDEEYAVQRRALVTEGVGILQELDDLPAPDASPTVDPIEAVVLAFRQRGTVPAPEEEALRCPECGAAARAGDAFCSRCGAKLASKNKERP